MEKIADFIMLIGLPGSGKSTYIRKYLADNPDKDYAVISSDDIIEEKCLTEGLTYSEGFEKFIGFAAAEMKRRAKAAVAAKRNIVWDQTNMTAKARRSKMDMAKGYEFHAVVFSLMDDELFRRLKHRADTTGKTIPAFVIKNMAKSYQAPEKAEGFKSIKVIRS